LHPGTQYTNDDGEKYAGKRQDNCVLQPFDNPRPLPGFMKKNEIPARIVVSQLSKEFCESF